MSESPARERRWFLNTGHPPTGRKKTVIGLSLHWLGGVVKAVYRKHKLSDSVGAALTVPSLARRCDAVMIISPHQEFERCEMAVNDAISALQVLSTD